MDESKVGLVRTLLIGQALSWFASIEKYSPILNKFKAFLAMLVEAFEEYNKVQWQ